MRQMIRLSITSMLVGLLFLGANSLHAMPVAGPTAGEEGDISLDIGGFAGVTTQYIQQFEVNGEAPPASFATITEGRLNVTFGNDTLSVTESRWIREGNAGGAAGPLSNAQLGLGPGNDQNDYEFVQATWRPADNLRVDMGSMTYLPWSDRSVEWEYFSTVDGVHTAGTYQGYTEDEPGIDFTYGAGAIDVGVGLFTRGIVTEIPAALAGGATPTTTTTQNDPSGALGNNQSARTIVPHLVFSGGPLALRASYYLESIEACATTAGNVDCGDTETVDNTLTVVDVKFNYGAAGNDFIKLDFIAADGDFYDGVDFNGDGTGDTDASTLFAGTLSKALGDNAVWLSFEQTTNTWGSADTEQTLLQIGYQLALAAGSNARFEYEQRQDGDKGQYVGGTDSTASAFNFTLFQTF